MSACLHESFVADVEVTRLGDGPEITDFVARLTIRCADCDAPFGFKGPPGGRSIDEPRCAVDALAIDLPLMTPTELELAGPLPVLARGPMVYEVARLAPPPAVGDGEREEDGDAS